MNKPLRNSNIFVTLVICGIVALTFPQKAHAFLGMDCPFQKNCLLTCAINKISKQTNRDIVVVNKKGVIIADTICSNIGKKYAHSKGNEVSSTLADGKCRMFIEKSADYPKGIKEKVTAIKNKKGQIIGAVILSIDPVSKSSCCKH